MRAGSLRHRAEILILTPALAVASLGQAWVNIRNKDEADITAQAGLRSRALVQIRARYRPMLLPGRYLRHGQRLLHIDSVRDPTNQRSELVMTASELVGEAAEFRPLEGVPIPCRVHLTHEAPYRDQLGQATEYRTRAEVALIEVGRAQPDDQLLVAGQLYNVIAYADESDDGVVRGLWLAPVD